ncbi:MAG TPA: VOC family protein [Micromonosporaceae bacterium]|nr:VOC family protein [Micromonosporaceae bacterium]
MSVPARLSLVTLGVTDLARATAFYAALGWPLSSASVPDQVSFFHTAGGLLALWSTAELAADANLTAAGPLPDFRGVAMAINVESPAEVDAALDAAVAAGGTILRPATETSWGGYNGYFADPDGWPWEVAHNPGWPIGDDERPVLP